MKTEPPRWLAYVAAGQSVAYFNSVSCSILVYHLSPNLEVPANTGL